MRLLEDRIALITGTASGIGRASALLFAEQGAQVIGIDIDAAGGEATAAASRAAGHRAEFHCADVTSEAALRALAQVLAQRLPCVDILFNNAGRVAKQRFEETTPAVWDEMIATNLTGGFLCAQAFLPLLKKARSGSIINHASIDASLGNPGIAAYVAAKGGWIPLTHVMAHDLGKYGIRVNTLSTGGIATAMTAQNGARNRSRVEVTPLQRQGRPEEAAHAALFLASDWASFVNGSNLVVDGGRTGITQGCYDP